MTTRTYDAHGYRRIRPGERNPGLTELRLPNGRTFQCVGVGPEVDRAIERLVERAVAVPAQPSEVSNVR